MRAQAQTASRSFPLHPVEPAASPLPTHKTQESMKTLLGGKVEACCDYTADCVTNVSFHPVLAAANFAYAQHRPLVLSPDMVWVTVVQGLAQHVRNHAEQLRHHFVGHQGKLEIKVERPDILRGSPENAWGGVIHDFSGAIKKHLGRRYDQLVSDFSTTGPVERTACEVALLDTFQPYFEYRLVAGCGIPEITLEGTTEDWQRLRNKIEALAPYDLDWWLPSLRAICDHFVRASQGDVDQEHWRDICKQEKFYGTDILNGWLTKLVPYLKNYRTGNFTVRNPLLHDPTETVTSTQLPNGVSQVPFVCQYGSNAEDSAMEFLGGFVGVTQDATTLALRPKLGWAVRQGSALDRLFARLSKHQLAPPLESAEFDRCLEGFSAERRCEFPGDFLLFYKKCNGVSLFGQSQDAGYRFRPLERLEVIEALQTQPPADYNGRIGNWDYGPWGRFCDLPDGSFAAIELSQTYQRGWKVARVASPEASRTSTMPIVAWSFQEFLDRALAGGGYWFLPELIRGRA